MVLRNASQIQVFEYLKNKKSVLDGIKAFFIIFIFTLRSETIFGNWKTFQNDEKRVLFHLKSSVRSEDIYFFLLFD